MPLPALFVFGSSLNPGLKELAKDYKVGSLENNTAVVSYASANNIDLAIIGPEKPLSNGIVDVLQQVDVATIGPTKQLAQIETSKGFARQLLMDYKISGNPQFMIHK